MCDNGFEIGRQMANLERRMLDLEMRTVHGHISDCPECSLDVGGTLADGIVNLFEEAAEEVEETLEGAGEEMEEIGEAAEEAGEEEIAEAAEEAAEEIEEAEEAAEEVAEEAEEVEEEARETVAPARRHFLDRPIFQGRNSI